MSVHKRYRQAWDDLVEALDDFKVPQEAYVESLEEIMSDLESRLDAARADMKHNKLEE